MSLSDFGQAGDVRLWLAAPKDLRSPLSGTEKGNPMQLDRIKNPYERVAVAEDKVIAALEKFPAATVLPSVLNYASELQACAVAAEEHLLKTNSPKKVFRVFEEEIWELSAACRRVPCDLHSDDAVIARMRDIVHQLDLDEQALVMKKVARQLFVRHRRFLKPN